MNRELAYQCALAFLLAVAIGLAFVAWNQHRPQFAVEPAPVTPAEAAGQVPWRLLTTCPIDRRNIPHMHPETKT